MRLLISGGGTGGHLFPALAVARAFQAEDPQGQLLLVGRKGGPEERIAPAAGVPLATIAIRGLDRDALWKNAVLPVLGPAALLRAVRLVRGFAPDVVLGVGGYVMAPAIAAARLLRVPYVLHEQNVLPGLATRAFAARAAAVCVTFPGTESRLRARRVEVTGLPLRPDLPHRLPEVPPRRLLVTGGSQGARHLNQTTWAALDQLLERFQEVIHLTGSQGEAESQRYARAGYRPIAFTPDVPSLLAEADLVLSRAGLGTISEVAAVGLPAILVPGTFGGGHQEHNARALVESGAAVRIGDAELTPGTLIELIDSLQPDQLREMARKASELGKRDAAQRVLAVLRDVAKAA